MTWVREVFETPPGWACSTKTHVLDTPFLNVEENRDAGKMVAQFDETLSPPGQLSGFASDSFISVLGSA
jgi:hypothetical protein